MEEELIFAEEGYDTPQKRDRRKRWFSALVSGVMGIVVGFILAWLGFVGILGAVMSAAGIYKEGSLNLFAYGALFTAYGAIAMVLILPIAGLVWGIRKPQVSFVRVFFTFTGFAVLLVALHVILILLAFATTSP